MLRLSFVTPHGYITPAASGAYVWAKWLHRPCVESVDYGSVPNVAQKDTRRATAPPLPPFGTPFIFVPHWLIRGFVDVGSQL